jgi:GWxTD domain-containing protein
MHRGAFTLIFLLVSIQVFGQVKYTSQYETGMRNLENKDTVKAESFFTESIDIYKDAPSYYQLGRIQLNRSGQKQIKKARLNFAEAVKLESGNITYRIAYAGAIGMNDYNKALAEYEGIIKDFPGSVEPYVQAGCASLTKYNLYRNNYKMVISGWINYKEADEYYLNAEKYFLKALEINPSCKDALMGVSILYLNSKNSNKALQYLCRLCKIDPRNKDAHLHLARLYAKRNEPGFATDEFETAFTLMSSEEKDDYRYKSVVEMLKAKYEINEHYDYKSEIVDLIKKFWIAYDPSFNPDPKERMLEHYTRVAYTNFNFSNPKSGLKGWQTERGNIYIRYGTPDSVKSISAYKGHKALEVWVYKDFTLSFEDYYRDGNLVLSNGSEGNNDEYENPEREPDSYNISEDLKLSSFQDFKARENKLNLFADLYTFKNPESTDQNSMNAYLIHVLPIQITGSILDFSKAEFDYDIRVYDSELNLVFGKEGSVRINELADLLKETKNIQRAHLVEFPLPLDKGMLVFKLKRLSDSSSYCYRYDYDGIDFAQEGIFVSDLVPATSVEKDKSIRGAIQRGSFSVIPRLTGKFNQSQFAYIYFEIYGLTKWKNDYSYFEREISVRRQDDTKGEQSFGSVISGVVNSIFGKKTEMTQTSEFKKQEMNVGQFIKLDLSKYEPGEYEVVVKIKDKVTGNKVEKKSYIAINSK